MRTICVSGVGVTKTFAFPTDCLVGVVLREVAMAFNLQVPSRFLALTDDLGNPLDPANTLDQEGVVEGEPLEIITLGGR